jgi:DNA-directed RNA polymerase specialized sigma subunit
MVLFCILQLLYKTTAKRGEPLYRPQKPKLYKNNQNIYDQRTTYTGRKNQTRRLHRKRSPEYKQETGMKMLRLHSEKGLSYAQIGKRFGVTRQRVQQLIKELITK